MTGWPTAVAQRVGDAGLRAATAVWLPRFQGELDLVPRPADRARQVVAGPDPVRVLVFGNGLANGFGVRTQDLALPGALARALRERTGRGVEVDLDSRRGMRAESVPARLAELRLQRYDLVVVALGPTDAGAVLPIDRWRTAMRALLSRLHGTLHPQAMIVALSILPMQRSPRGGEWTLDRVQAYARRMDAATREVAAEFDSEQVRFVGLEPVLADAGERQFGSALGYAAIAENLATIVGPRLPDASSRSFGGGDADDDARIAALDGSGLFEALPSERLIRLVRSARAMFGVRAVALTLAGRDTLRVVTRSGVEIENDRPPREGSLIDRVLWTDGVYELADVRPGVSAWLPRLPTGPIRYYAGLAIETPSGHPIGGLCLFDDSPRPRGSVDETAMRALVAQVQAELWDAVAVRS